MIEDTTGEARIIGKGYRHMNGLEIIAIIFGVINLIFGIIFAASLILNPGQFEGNSRIVANSITVLELTNGILLIMLPLMN